MNITPSPGPPTTYKLELESGSFTDSDSKSNDSGTFYGTAVVILCALVVIIILGFALVKERPKKNLMMRKKDF